MRSTEDTTAHDNASMSLRGMRSAGQALLMQSGSCCMQLATEGVTEDDVLRHAVLVLEHAFQRIDARPLPGGQAVAIVDLAGLALPDLAPLLRLAMLARFVLSWLALHACLPIPTHSRASTS